MNKGSRNATDAGLYHFTTQISQAKEANSVVDIGFHYVAVDTATDLPLDTDGDGVSDYFEDRDGNGTVGSGETDWRGSGDLGLRFGSLDPGPTSDSAMTSPRQLWNHRDTKDESDASARDEGAGSGGCGSGRS